jgi:polyhydroxyalkanoate synthesis regulator phasin
MAKQSTGAASASDPAAEESGSRAEQSVQAFRDALEKSVTISRERLQEVVDDAVRRGRMTRGDAEELVSRLVTRGREQAEDILGELEKLLDEVGGRADKARKRAVGAVDRRRQK